MEQNSKITAHSGAEGTKPNTEEFLQMAFSCGADGLEVDIRRNREGVLVLSHDRPTGGETTLEEMLRLLAAHPGMYANCDLKETGLTTSVYDLAKRCGVLPEQLLFTGCVLAEEIAGAAGSLVFYNLEEAPFGGLRVEGGKINLQSAWKAAAYARQFGAQGMNLNFRAATDAVRRICTNAGLLLTVWTPSTPEDLRAAIAMRPYSITTNAPGLARALLEE